MTLASGEEPAKPPPLGKALAFWVAGFMLAGCLGGAAVRQLIARSSLESTGPVLAAEDYRARAAEATPETAAAAPRRVLRLRAADIAVPDDPFQPTAAAPPPPPAAALAAARQSGSPAPGAVAAAGSVPVGGSAPAKPRFPEDISVVGVVQGDPPLVVVRNGGQTIFLKIGEQIADNWRLEEIRERSAVFQLGSQRVEVPIKGGS